MPQFEPPQVKRPWWKMLSNKNWETVEDHVRGDRIIWRTWSSAFAVWMASVLVSGMTDRWTLGHRVAQAVSTGGIVIIAALFIYYVVHDPTKP